MEAIVSTPAFTLFVLLHDPDLALDVSNREAFESAKRRLAARIIAGAYDAHVAWEN
jgi:hypothetical protein